MSDDKVTLMPNFKKGATPEERLLELAQLARKDPEKFKRFVIFYEEETEEQLQIRTLVYPYEDDIKTTLGLVEMGRTVLLRGTFGY